MSLNFKPLTPVLVKDPRMILDGNREYAVLQSGKWFQNKQWTSTSISSSNINFSCPPPSRQEALDRRVSLTLPMRLTIIVNDVPPGKAPLNPLQDGPRAFPIHSMLDTVILSINGARVTQNMGEIIHALLRFNNCDDLTEMDYSETPSYLDNCQNYHDLYGSNRSPLSMAGASPDGAIPGRGAFNQYKIVDGTNEINDTDAPVDKVVLVDMICTEQIMLSPLYWGSYQKNEAAFTNITTNDWTFSFLNQAGNRAWSHDSIGGGTIPDNGISVAFSGFTSPAFSFGTNDQPILNMNYITPEDDLYISPHTPLVYPYYQVMKYATDTSAIAYGSTRNVVSNNIQLSSIPRRVYVYARQSNETYYKNAAVTDTFYGISRLSVQFQNYANLFTSATQNQLWQMSRKNHCNISWQDWNGIPYYKEGGVNFSNADEDIFGGTGSVIAIEFATDVGLSQINAPGVGNSSYNLQINCDVFNIDPSGALDDKKISLYVLVVSEGVFNITESGAAQTDLSVLSQMDVLDAKKTPWLNYNDVQDVNGGNFMSGLKNLGKTLSKGNQFLKNTKLISRGADALSYIPGPQQDVVRGVGDIASYLGYGVVGDGITGGARLGRKNLKSRARRS